MFTTYKRPLFSVFICLLYFLVASYVYYLVSLYLYYSQKASMFTTHKRPLCGVFKYLLYTRADIYYILGYILGHSLLREIFNFFYSVG
jgi:hypothetical protein